MHNANDYLFQLCVYFDILREGIMKKIRLLSFFLSLVLVLGLFTSFPALTSHKAAAALTNFSYVATYKGGSNAVPNTNAAYGEENWYNYHTGKLNDGVIDTGYTESSSKNVEMWYTGIVGGTFYVYFQLPYEVNVSQVDVYVNNRSTGGVRGYPQSVNIYVGNSESPTTLLGTTSRTQYNTSVYNYSASGLVKGNIVILQFTTTNATAVIALTEVNILGTLPPSNNIAGGSMYKASSNCADNGDATYGEANWNTYHYGRLNDGIIASTYTPSASSATQRHSVEFWAGAYDNIDYGTMYIYFALPSIRTISTVNIYANTRESNSSRGYPASVNVYVGNSESDISEATKLGTVSYSSYNTSVRKYTASGSAIGSYVIIEITNAAPAVVVALTEVEIIETKKNTASTVQYRSNTVANGSASTDTYGEPNWSTYHAGRLNDGVIAPTYVPADKNSTDKTNIEMWLDGFVAGKAYVYFKLNEVLDITQVNVYANNRESSTNRCYPSEVNIYVGNSETDISANTKLGTSSYTAYNDSVRNYITHGSKKGSYVIVELVIPTDAQPVIALTEVEISTAEATTGTKTLAAAEIKSSTKTATYTVPTITWAAVENATAYDVYLNGAKVVSDTTALSYTPDGLTPFNLYGKGDNRSYETVYIVAKADGYEPSTSNTVSFRYVDKPTDRLGNPMSSADFIIDAGHGGTDPGATNTNGREEADDNLNMALSVGKLLEDIGYTVAYTRITDVFDSVAVKSAKGEAGSFNYYLCFHRNSATSEAYGVEYLYRTDDAASLEFAKAFETEFVADAIWTNRGTKARSDLTVLNNNTIPTVLLELGFISTSAENDKFDTYFNETAQAVARAAIKHYGATIGFAGGFNSPTEAGFTSAYEASVTIDKAETKQLSFNGWLLHTLGVKNIQYSIDGAEWTDAALSDRSAELTSYTSFKAKANSGFTVSLDTSALKTGEHTVKFRGVTVWDETTKYINTFDFATITLSVSDSYEEERGGFYPNAEYRMDTSFSTKLAAEYGNWDTDGDGKKDFVGIAVTVSVVDITYEHGIYGIEGFLNFDNTYLTPLFVDDNDLNGDGTIFVKPSPVLSWPTVSITIQNNTYNLPCVEGICQSYSMADGSTVNPNNPDQTFSKEYSRMRFRYILHTDYFAGYTTGNDPTGITEDNAMQLRYYFTVAEGHVGDTFTFTVPDSPDAEHIAYAKLYAPAYDPNPNNKVGLTSVYGKGDEVSVTVTELPTEHTVIFMANGGEIDRQTVADGEAATAPTPPAVEGYTFEEWDVDFSNVTSDLTVTAVYKINYYKVSFVAGANGTLSGETAADVPYGTDIADITFPQTVANNGYKFSSWDITSGTVKADTVITASFVRDDTQWFSVTYIVPSQGTTTDVTEFGPFVTGTSWEDAGIVAPTVTGIGLYAFDHWEGVVPQTITENLVFTAVMTLQGQAQISFSCGDNGVICRNVDGQVVVGAFSISADAGAVFAEAVTLPYALADDGYVFDGWYCGESKYDQGSIIDSDLELVAVFKPVAFEVTGTSVSVNNSLAEIVLTISAENADFASKMYVFNQFYGGRTVITGSAINISADEGATNSYKVTFTVEASQTEYVDVFFTAGDIDFSKDDWNILKVVTDIKLR